MLIFKRTTETMVAPEIIWNIWQDVKNWNTWSYPTEYSYLEGAFKEETKGKWKSRGGPLLEILLTQIEPLKVFVLEYKLFLAQIISSHYLTNLGKITKITQQVEIKGPLAFLYAYFIGNKLKKDLSLEMKAMIKKAESLSKE